uniref:Uncharacterized protein n=1 Tax=Parascaris equorum TaxID=6256 RepID=A0A914RHC2_PAREQ
GSFVVGEYLRVWFQVPDNPLVCLLLALTFTHMACKKDISSRHMVALRVSHHSSFYAFF